MVKKRISNLIVIGMVLSLMTTAFAFAGDSPGSPEGSAAIETKNMLVTGQVTSVRDNEGYRSITIDNEDMGMVFHTGEDVFVVDKKTNAYLSVGDIEIGMTVTAVLDKMSPMTMSLPPQTNGAIGFIVNSDEGFMDLSVYNEELVNLDNTLKLNIDKDSNIVDRKGSKKFFGAEDLMGSECLVLYTISTRSIPAQTYPEMVIILASKEELNTEDLVKAEGDAAYVLLRDNAEAKGYAVKWTSHHEPIVLTKDDIRIEITIGSVDFTIEHKTKDLKPLDLMEKLDLVVKLENGKTIVPDTFIEAL